MNLYTECTVEVFEHDAKLLMEEYQKRTVRMFCHLAAQVDFVFSENRDRKLCTHVLHMANLTNDFNALMSSYDIPLTMETRIMPVPNPETDARPYCGVRVEDVSVGTKQLIR